MPPPALLLLEFGLEAVLGRELFQRFIQGQQVVGKPRRGRLGEIQIEPLPVAAVPVPVLLLAA